LALIALGITHPLLHSKNIKLTRATNMSPAVKSLLFF